MPIALIGVEWPRLAAVFCARNRPVFGSSAGTGSTAVEAEIEAQRRAGETREHAGRYLQTAEADSWNGGRYTWPEVVSQTWAAAGGSQDVFKLLDELDLGD